MVKSHVANEALAKALAALELPVVSIYNSGHWQAVIEAQTAVVRARYAVAAAAAIPWYDPETDRCAACTTGGPATPGCGCQVGGGFKPFGT